MLFHMRVPWYPALPPHTVSPWWSPVMSKRATAQSAASSLVHIYKPDPVATHCVKPPRLAKPCRWQKLKERFDSERSIKELQAQSKPASNNEQQIAMGTRSLLLLTCWTNSGWTNGKTYVILPWPTFTFSKTLIICLYYTCYIVIVI